MKFNYRAPPIVAKYMRSDAHTRVIQGPQGPLSCDTEFLTPTGWKRMDAYVAGDQLAEWDSTTGQVAFVEPLEYHVKACETFLHFHNEHSLSMVMSEEHRVPCYDWKGRFTVKSAAQLARRPSKTRIPVSFATTSPGVPLTTAQIRLAVAQYADGCIDSSGATVITLRKERKKTRLRELVAACGLKLTERQHAGRPTETIFRFRWPHTDKKFKPWWYGASELQLQAVVTEAVLWDGTRTGGESVYYSRHKSDADFIQFAVHATGGRGSISRRTYPENPEWSDAYSVHIAVAGSVKAHVYVRGDNTTITETPSADGAKYCFTTNKGFFVARHDGCVFITGNSGKSSGSCIELLRRSISRRPDSDGVRRARWVVVRNTVPLLRDTTIPTFLQWFPHGTLGQWHATDKYYHFKFGDVDAQVLFRALDDKDDIAKLLSSEYTGCYFNEFREIEPAIFEAMTKRVGRWKTDPTWTQQDLDAAWYGIWADTNPPQVGSWLHQMLEKATPNKWDVFKQPSGRSPEAENIDHLRSDYYDTDGLSDEYIRVMIDGEYGYDQSGLPVLGKLFIPTWHVTPEPLRANFSVDRPLLIGIDAGLKPAAAIGQVDYQGRLLTLGECYVKSSESMGMERFCTTMLLPYLNSRFPMAGKAYVTADPAVSHRSQANEVTVYDILTRYFFVAPAYTDKLPARLTAAETWLSGQVGGGAKVVFDPFTPHLQAAIAHNYRFAKKKSVNSMFEDTKDKPEKDHASNIADAWMYLCMHVAGGNASQLRQPARPVVVSDGRGWT